MMPCSQGIHEGSGKSSEGLLFSYVEICTSNSMGLRAVSIPVLISPSELTAETMKTDCRF